MRVRARFDGELPEEELRCGAEESAGGGAEAMEVCGLVGEESSEEVPHGCRSRQARRGRTQTPENSGFDYVLFYIYYVVRLSSRRFDE